MAKLVVLLLLGCVFASFCEAKPYDFNDYFREHLLNKRDAEMEVLMKPCLARINEIRKEHKAKPLSWDMFEARYADQWARHILDVGSLSKDPQGYASDMAGESIAKIQMSGSPTEKCIMAVNAWYYSQASKYKSEGGCGSANGVKGTEDFTRLVWKTTDKIGMAVEGDVVDVRFFPHGNFEDEFREDVDC